MTPEPRVTPRYEWHGSLLWVVNGKQMYPADPQAYQDWLSRRNPEVTELERMFKLEDKR